ncbi:hypothetical protein EAE96_000528 [Botrytis aclada]|nr:hypothetical protein EAE96_000528 [Botrytis aclada]
MSGQLAAVDALESCAMSSVTSVSDVEGTGSPLSMSSIPDVAGIGDSVPVISTPDATGTGDPAPTSSTGDPAPTISITDGTGTGNASPVMSTGDPAPIDNNDNNNNNDIVDETSQAEHKTNRFKGLKLAQRLRLIAQEYFRQETPHGSIVSAASFLIPPLPSGDFNFSFPTAVPTTVPHPVSTTANATVEESVSLPTDEQPSVPANVHTIVDTIADITAEESNLPSADEQPSFPYTIHEFTNSGLLISEISGVDVEEQYHHIKTIVGEACGKCSKCTSDNRVRDLIDTIIDVQFPDLDTCLFRDGILKEFGFHDYWTELKATKPEITKHHEKYEKWYAQVWEDIEQNNDLPAISELIEEEFCQSREFRRILAGAQGPTCKWRKMILLLFVMRMRRIRGKLDESSQEQESQETQTIETTAEEKRKTREKEKKRRKLRNREDKVAAKLLHDTATEVQIMSVGENMMNVLKIPGCYEKMCASEDLYVGWENTEIFLPFINIQEFVSIIKAS